MNQILQLKILNQISILSSEMLSNVLNNTLTDRQERKFYKEVSKETIKAFLNSYEEERKLCEIVLMGRLDSKNYKYNYENNIELISSFQKIAALNMTSKEKGMEGSVIKSLTKVFDLNEYTKKDIEKLFEQANKELDIENDKNKELDKETNKEKTFKIKSPAI